MKLEEKNDLNKSIFLHEEDEVNKSYFKDENVVADLKKAWEAGTGITPQTQPDGSALRMEALDPNIYVTTWGEDDFTIYKDIQKQEVRQTVVKYVQYTSHGQTGHSRFVPEIGIGSVNNPTLGQKTAVMKYIVDTKQQSFAMGMVNTIADPESVLEMSAVADIIKTIEWATFYGDASLTSQADETAGLEFDGLVKLIDPNNVIDARGKELDPVMLNQAAVKIGQGFGVANHAYMPIGVKAGFINKHLPAQRVLLPNAKGEGMQAGLDIARFLSARGHIELSGSTIMDLDNVLNEDVKPSTTLLKPTVTAAEDSTEVAGNFLAEDVQEDGVVTVPSEVNKKLEYKVVAFGKGQSEASDVASATLTSASHSIKLTITLNQLGGDIPDFVSIYRKSLVKGDNRFLLIARVPASQMTSNQIVFHDTDDIIAGTADVFVGDVNPSTIAYLQLAPISKFDLALTTTAVQWAVLWYGCLVVRYPKRFVRIKNVAYANGQESTKF